LPFPCALGRDVNIDIDIEIDVVLGTEVELRRTPVASPWALAPLAVWRDVVSVRGESSVSMLGSLSRCR
jgi:hypothetical protein